MPGPATVIAGSAERRERGQVPEKQRKLSCRGVQALDEHRLVGGRRAKLSHRRAKLLEEPGQQPSVASRLAAWVAVAVAVLFASVMKRCTWRLLFGERRDDGVGAHGQLLQRS